MTGPIALAALREAREWIGTPYVHQASAKGHGADCLGLLCGIWRKLYGDLPEAIPAYSPDWSEAAKTEDMWCAARRHLRSKSLARPAAGDVVLFRMHDRAVAKHVGVTAEVGRRSSFVHAFSGHGVVESPLSTPWERRIVARFSFPERIC